MNNSIPKGCALGILGDKFCHVPSQHLYFDVLLLDLLSFNRDEHRMKYMALLAILNWNILTCYDIKRMMMIVAGSHDGFGGSQGGRVPIRMLSEFQSA